MRTPESAGSPGHNNARLKRLRVAMVTGAKKVFELIARGFPALVCCKDMLVLAPTEGILRGFVLEMTGAW